MSYNACLTLLSCACAEANRKDCGLCALWWAWPHWPPTGREAKLNFLPSPVCPRPRLQLAHALLVATICLLSRHTIVFPPPAFPSPPPTSYVPPHPLPLSHHQLASRNMEHAYTVSFYCRACATSDLGAYSTSDVSCCCHYNCISFSDALLLCIVSLNNGQWQQMLHNITSQTTWMSSPTNQVYCKLG